jgi:hypothetical protein
MASGNINFAALKMKLYVDFASWFVRLWISCLARGEQNCLHVDDIKIVKEISGAKNEIGLWFRIVLEEKLHSLCRSPMIISWRIFSAGIIHVRIVDQTGCVDSRMRTEL